MTYALVPLPEKNFNGSEKITVSEKDVVKAMWPTVSEKDLEEAMKRVRINCKKEGLSLPVVRYRTRPQVTENELTATSNIERVTNVEDQDDPDDL